jgi:3-deoxy-D-manno-octulosonate 8-phosphate phosphatase (KDO 8-P phosphatase)
MRDGDRQTRPETPEPGIEPEVGPAEIMAELDPELRERAHQLSWLLFDVDGVLTDGKLAYDADGEAIKFFHVRDGLGLKLAQRAGLRVGVLSGRRSPALQRRLEELGLDERILARSDKAHAFADFLERRHLVASQVAFVGDDLLDLPVLRRCGLSFAPANAAPEVRQGVDRVLSRRGGEGAVRETVELVLRARGDWEKVIEVFLNG